MNETNHFRENARECLKQASERGSAEDRELFLEAAAQSLWIAAVLDQFAERCRRIDRRPDKLSRVALK